MPASSHRTYADADEIFGNDGAGHVGSGVLRGVACGGRVCRRVNDKYHDIPAARRTGAGEDEGRARVAEGFGMGRRTSSHRADVERATDGSGGGLAAKSAGHRDGHHRVAQPTSRKCPLRWRNLRGRKTNRGRRPRGGGGRLRRSERTRSRSLEGEKDSRRDARAPTYAPPSPRAPRPHRGSNAERKGVRIPRIEASYLFRGSLR